MRDFCSRILTGLKSNKLPYFSVMRVTTFLLRKLSWFKLSSVNFNRKSPDEYAVTGAELGLMPRSGFKASTIASYATDPAISSRTENSKRKETYPVPEVTSVPEGQGTGSPPRSPDSDAER